MYVDEINLVHDFSHFTIERDIEKRIFEWSTYRDKRYEVFLF